MRNAADELKNACIKPIAAFSLAIFVFCLVSFCKRWSFPSLLGFGSSNLRKLHRHELPSSTFPVGNNLAYACVKLESQFTLRDLL